MPDIHSTKKRVAVLGGGITGLAAAHRLGELAPDVETHLFEAEHRLGGVLQTTRTADGFLLEHSADNFITNLPYGVELCRRLGIENELLPTNEALRKAYVVRRGKLLPVPDGFLLMAPGRAWPIVTSRILTWRGKIRLALERFVPRRALDGDESLHSFVTRRMGREAYERLVQPLIGGIYTADPTKLSVQATLRQFVDMEREHGSLIKGMRKRQAAQGAGRQSGARYSMFVAPRHGMGQLVERLAERLPTQRVHLGQRVNAVRREATGWRLQLADRTEAFDAVLVALPAPQAARVLEQQTEIAERLRQIPYAGCSVAILTVDQSQVRNAVPGFGFVVPEIENRRILAVSFSSHKFPGRAPHGKALIRVFVGGALHPELAELSDEQLRHLVVQELAQLIGLVGDVEGFYVTRWNGKMPQYHLGHTQRVEALEQQVAQLPGLELAGNAYHGVGVPQCIQTGEQAAERIAKYLAGVPAVQPETS